MKESSHTKKQTKKTLSDTTISVFIFFIAGMTAGCIAAYIFRNGIYSYIFHLYQSLLTQLQDSEVNKQDFFLLAARRNLKYLLLIWFFSFTNIWRYYYRLFSGYTGIQNGLLVSFCVQINGLWGITGFLCFLLPQALLLIPSFLISFNHCEKLHENLHSITIPRYRLFLCEFPFFAASLLLLLLGCFLEASFSPALLRLYFH